MVWIYFDSFFCVFFFDKDIMQRLRFEPSLIKISFCSKVHVIQVIKLFSYNNDASKLYSKIINWINKLISYYFLFRVFAIDFSLPQPKLFFFITVSPKLIQSEEKKCFSLLSVLNLINCHFSIKFHLSLSIFNNKNLSHKK